MLVTLPYNRDRAVSYARAWALGRNPLFLSFTGIGGDCTNFVSQSIYAGGCVMNYTETFGWYYITSSNRTASWTGVQYLYNFLTSNKGVGPYAVDTTLQNLASGDVIQLGRADGQYYHTLIISGFDGAMPLVCSHSTESLDRRLDTYTFEQARFLHIMGVRAQLEDLPIRSCYSGLISGERI